MSDPEAESVTSPWNASASKPEASETNDPALAADVDPSHPGGSASLRSAEAEAQPMTAAELRQWAERYAEDATDLAQSSDGSAHVIFQLGGERFAVPLADLDEVARIEVGIGLTHAPTLVLGLVNIRGEVVPMLDTGAALGRPGSYRLGNANRTLVVRDTRDRRTALPVDRIESIELLSPAQFQPRARGEATSLIRRIGIGEHAGGSLTLLDIGGLRCADADTF